MSHTQKLAKAGAILRDVSHRAPDSARRLIDEAIYQIGQAVYGRNSLAPRLVRQGTRSALALVLRARKVNGAPHELGVAAVLLRAALRHTGR